MKKFLAIILCLTMCVLFTGCRYDSEYFGDFFVGYSETLNDAFVGIYCWDGTEEKAKIVIPEEYNGIPITTLGGEAGKVASSFSIAFYKDFQDELCNNGTTLFSAPEFVNIKDYQNIKMEQIEIFNFDLHISKNIEKIERLCLDEWCHTAYGDYGDQTDKIFVSLFNITCDEENKVFYAKDGKLYYREKDTLVSDIFYHDFDVENYVKKYINETNEETEESEKFENLGTC